MKYIFASAAMGAGGYALGQLGAGPMSFNADMAAPMLAGAGAALPPLYWLLSNIPPIPADFKFPGFSLFTNDMVKTQKPATMPITQKLLYAFPFAAAFVAAATPQLYDHFTAQEKGPYVITVDNSWASAQNWEQRKSRVNDLLEAAADEDRQVVLVPMAGGAEENADFSVMDVFEARTIMLNMEPVSWPVDYEATMNVLDNMREEIGETANIYWLNSCVDRPEAYTEYLNGMGPLTLFQPEDNVHLLSLVKNTGTEMTVKVQRCQTEDVSRATLVASNERGQPLLYSDVAFEEGATEAEVSFRIPTELRQDIVRIGVEGEDTAGATLLLDDNYRQRSVALLETGSRTEERTSGTFFIQNAVSRFTDFHKGGVDNVLKLPPSAIIRTDETTLLSGDRDKLARWVSEGGMLITFSGPNLAAKPDDNLLPVPIRSGVKSLTGGLGGDGGAARIAEFERGSPFYGLEIPENVDIRSVTLSEPGPNLEDYTWAEIEQSDGSRVPLVTARQEGDGWLVSFNVTANMEWSTLPFAGDFYLKMLRAVVSYSSGQVNDNQLNRNLPAESTLAASGRLVPANTKIEPLTQSVLTEGRMDAVHPPGYYGDRKTTVAYNVSDAVEIIGNFDPLNIPEQVTSVTYGENISKHDYGAYAWSAAFLAMFAFLALQIKQEGPATARSKKDKGRESGSENQPNIKPS